MARASASKRTARPRSALGREDLYLAAGPNHQHVQAMLFDESVDPRLGPCADDDRRRQHGDADGEAEHHQDGALLLCEEGRADIRGHDAAIDVIDHLLGQWRWIEEQRGRRRESLERFRPMRPSRQPARTARVSTSVADLNVDDASTVLSTDGASGYCKHGALFELDADVRGHLGPKQPAVAVLDLDGHDVLDDVVLDGRRGVDGRHATLEVSSRKCVNRETRGVTRRNLADVDFVHVRVQLEPIEVDDRHEGRCVETRRHGFALLCRD